MLLLREFLGTSNFLLLDISSASNDDVETLWPLREFQSFPFRKQVVNQEIIIKFTPNSAEVLGDRTEKLNEKKKRGREIAAWKNKDESKLTVPS